MCQVKKYGWKATCPQCGFETCVTYVHPTKPNALIMPRCYNKLQHVNRKPVYATADNPIIQKYVKHP